MSNKGYGSMDFAKFKALKSVEELYIHWYDPKEYLPEGYETDSPFPVLCYGVYFDDSVPNGRIIRDHLRYNTDEKIWEWCFEEGYDYWEETTPPDYWAYQYMPKATFLEKRKENKNEIKN